jgi:hypothetical protein
MRGNMTYSVDLGTDAFGNITRINNALDSLDKRLEGQKSSLENLQKQEAAAREELDKPFPLEAEFQEKEERLVKLNADLNIDGDGDLDVLNDPENREDSEQEQQGDDEREEPSDNPMYSTAGESERRTDYSEQRTGTYGKAKPSLLDDLRNYNSTKQNSVPSVPSKSAEHEI